MNLKETLKELEALSNEATKKHYLKSGAKNEMYGVKLGDLKKVAKKIKSNHDLAMKLWATENIDARLLAVLILNPKNLNLTQLDVFVRSVNFVRVADWVNSYVVKEHPEKEQLREKWMNSKDPMAARAGWNLTSSKIAKGAEGLDLKALLDRLDREMASAPEEAQWTMNFALGHIGIHFPEHRKRALAIGEKLGIYRDYPCFQRLHLSFCTHLDQ